MAITQFDELVNKATSTLRTAHTAGDGLLRVFDASKFPTSGRVTCYQGTGPLSEQVYAILAYSSVDLTTNTLTVTGALEGTTDVNMPARTRIEIRGTAGQWNELTAAVNALESGGGGSVTSVALTVPSGLEVSGSPVTGTGTLAVTTTLAGIVKGDGTGFTTATAGTDYLTPSDIASIPASSITGTLPVTHGGTGLTSMGTADQVLLVKHDGSQLAYKNLTAGSNVSIAVDASDVTISSTDTTGVTEVGMTVPSGFSVSGSPVTSTGTLAVTTTLAGLVKGDGTGFVEAVAGTDYLAPGDVPTLVAGSNITLTPGAGTTTISSTDTTGVTSVGMSVPSGLSVSGSPVTSTGTLAIGTTLSGIVKGNGSGFVTAVSGTDYLAPGDVPTLVAGSNITLTPGAGTTTISSTDTTGVTSIAMTVPSGLSVSGSPVTTTGTLAVTTTLSGIVKGNGSGFTTATAGTDYVSPSGLTTTLGGYVDTSTTQTVSGQKTFGLTTIKTSAGVADTITTSNKGLVLEQTGGDYGTTRLKILGQAGLTGALFQVISVPVIDFGFLYSSTQRNIRGEFRDQYTFSGSNEFQFGNPGTPSFAVSDGGCVAFHRMAIIQDDWVGSPNNASAKTSPATLSVYGSIAISRIAVTADFTFSSTNAYLVAVTGGTAKTLTLPGTTQSGQQFVVKDEAGTAASNPITITPQGGQTIDGASSYVLNTNYGVVRLYSNGTNFFIM